MNRDPEEKPKVRLITSFAKGPRRRKRPMGFVLEYQGSKEPVTLTRIMTEETTENEAALLVVCKAIERFNGKPCEVEIYTDSRWFYSAATVWIWKWMHCFKEAQIKYKDIWYQYALFFKEYHPKVFLNKKTEYTKWLEGEVNARRDH